MQIVKEGQTQTQVRSFLYQIEDDPNEEHDLAPEHPEVAARLAAEIRGWRSQHPMAGTRGTLVPHPGWVAPRDWAEAVLPAAALQPRWRNELPFGKALLDATAERGVLVDEETKRALLEAEKARREAGLSN